MGFRIIQDFFISYCGRFYVTSEKLHAKAAQVIYGNAKNKRTVAVNRISNASILSLEHITRRAVLRKRVQAWFSYLRSLNSSLKS